MSEEPTTESTTEAEPSFKEAIGALVRLQLKDSEILGAQEQLDKIPVAIDEVKLRLETVKKEADATKETINKLTLDNKQTEGEIAKKDEEIKKRSGELQNAKSNDTYKALMSEIDNMKSEKDGFETKILENMDKMDEAKRNEGKLRQEVAEKAKVVEAEITQLENQKKDLEDKMAALNKERESLAQAVPGDIMVRYDKLKKKKSGVALAPLSEGASCGGCRMHLPQHVINDLLKQKDFVTCETCQRIIYLPQK